MKKAVSVTTFNNTMLGTIRGAEIDGRPHFVGNDLAVSLGYKNPAVAVSRYVPKIINARCDWMMKIIHMRNA